MEQMHSLKAFGVNNMLEREKMVKILTGLLEQLTFEEQLAIHFRFWECMTIAQIALCLEMSWDSADRLIETTLTKLRIELLEKTKPTRPTLVAA